MAHVYIKLCEMDERKLTKSLTLLTHWGGGGAAKESKFGTQARSEENVSPRPDGAPRDAR